MFYYYATVICVLENGLHALFEAAIDLLMLRLVEAKYYRTTPAINMHERKKVGRLNSLLGAKTLERWKIIGRNKSCADTASKSTQQLKSKPLIHSCRNKLQFAVVHSGDGVKKKKKKITFHSHGLLFWFQKLKTVSGLPDKKHRPTCAVREGEHHGVRIFPQNVER